MSTARTRIERAFDPETIRRLKATAQRDIGVGGPCLAAHALEAGLVDECHLFLAPSWWEAATGRSVTTSACGSS